MIDGLVGTARRLATSGAKGKPRQSDLRRAISTAYYALFHALAKDGADLFVGAAAAHPIAEWARPENAGRMGRAMAGAILPRHRVVAGAPRGDGRQRQRNVDRDEVDRMTGKMGGSRQERSGITAMSRGRTQKVAVAALAGEQSPH